MLISWTYKSTPSSIVHIILGMTMASQNSRACMNLFNPNLLNFFCLFLLLGHFRYVDLCSVHHEGQFYKWAFNSQYGFAGNVLAYADRYRSVLQSKKMEGGFLKALTMSKLRSVYFKVFCFLFFFILYHVWLVKIYPSALWQGSYYLTDTKPQIADFNDQQNLLTIRAL